jgi:flagellar biosynthesis/type III secretory pathway M-ring protein FliF/YscJ
MNQLRQVLANINKHLGALTVSQKLLIGTLCVLGVMTLLLVSRYAGDRKMTPLLPGMAAADQDRAATYLDTVGVTYTRDAQQQVLVPVESRTSLLARLGSDRKLPDDTTLLFRNLADKQHWMMPRSQLDQMYLIAVQNEMASVISSFPGVESAHVMLTNPEPRGLGSPSRKPSAQVTVFTRANAGLDQGTVDALADLVAGGVAGLDPADVRIIDGTKRRRYRAKIGDELSASSSFEQVVKIEQRVQDKLMEQLGYIDGVMIAVNAHVDTSRLESREKRVLPKGQGTESLIAKETTSSTSSRSGARGAEAGVRSNAGMDLASGGAGATNSTTNESTTEFENAVGTRETVTSDPSGRPTKIFVSVSVPRDWVAQVVKQAKAVDPAGAGGGGGGGGAGAPAPEPTNDEINQAWPAEQQRIRDLVAPLVATAVADPTGAAAAQAGEVVVSLIPVALAGLGGGGVGGVGGGASLGSSGSGGLVGTVVGGGIVKYVSLGGLAAVALVMMLLTVRKAGKTEALPSAQEIVGIPPALATVSDLVGEAGESDSAIEGIEVDDSQIKATKMLEQVADLIKSNPRDAGILFNRWVSPES